MKNSNEELKEMFDNLKQVYAEAIDYDEKSHKAYENAFEILDRFIILLNRYTLSDILIKGSTFANNIYIQSDGFNSDVFELLTQMGLDYSVDSDDNESITITIRMEDYK